jgi:UDP-3-O-[3-hydroxymyristoyl] glucosamine N-acyltransferase
VSAFDSGLRLRELAAALGGTLEGDPNLHITGIAGLEDAAPGTLVRVEAPRYLAAANDTPAAALLAPEGLEGVAKPCIRVAQVKLAYIRALELFARPEHSPEGVHRTAVVDESAQIAEGCSIGAGVVIGPGTRIGAGVVLHPHVVVMENVEIGPGCVLYPCVVVYPRTVLGERVRVHAGSVLGSDGYGYEWDGTRHVKRPHLGRLRVGDDVEIGANSTLDRATTGETVIGPGTKIDNLVQVAHNVRLGAHCLLVSQAGVAGSTVLGNGVVIGGQSAVKDNLTVADGVYVIGKGGVWGDLRSAGMYSGNPARPHSEEIRIQASLGRLPDLLKRVKELERRLAALEGEGDSPVRG